MQCTSRDANFGIHHPTCHRLMQQSGYALSRTMAKLQSRGAHTASIFMQVCNSKAVIVAMLNASTIYIMSDEEYICFICNETFKNLNLLSVHSDRDHLIVPPNEIIGQNKNLNPSGVHSDRASSIVPLEELIGRNNQEICIVRAYTIHQCLKCPKSYELKKNLMRHEKTSHAGRRHVCNVCQVPFASITYLNKHLQTWCHNNDVKKRTCRICGSKFMLSRTLNKHMTSAHEDQCLACYIYGKLYVEKNVS